MSNAPRRPRLPGLQVPPGLEVNLRDFLEKLKERAEVASGDHRDPLSRYVTVADLQAAGLANAAVKNKYATISSAVNATTEDAATLSTTLDAPQSLFSITREQLGDEQWMIIFDTLTNTYRRISVTEYEEPFARGDRDMEIGAVWRWVAAVGDDEDLTNLTQILFEDDDGVTGERVWQFLFDSSAFTINELDDDDANPVQVLSIVRGATAYIDLYSDIRFYSTGGVVLAAPTGGDQGAGTINAEGYYRDGVELPYEAPIDGVQYVRQDATWVINTAGGASLSGAWKFDSGVTAVDPGSKEFALDNATLASVTAIYFNDTSVQGFDASTILGFLATGMRIYIQQKDDATRAALFQVSGTPTDNTGWWTVPVTVVNSGTLYGTPNKECAVVFVLAVGAGGGSGANLTYTAATRVIASDTGTDATLPLVTSGDAGLAPASGGGTANFLRADGTWAAPSGGGVSDGDKGDVTVSAGGTVWTIDTSAVTYAKIQDVSATSRVLGRKTAGAGAIEELTAADLRTLLALVASDISNFDEAVDDRAAALFVAGANITLTYNDGANTLTIASTGGGGGGGYPPQLGFAGI